MKRRPFNSSDINADINTCPMHPEVQQDHPGDCPKCAMVLEPVTAKVEEKNEKLINMNRSET